MTCIKVKINYIKQPLSVLIYDNNFIKAETTCLNKQLSINTNSVDNILNVYCYKICNVTQNKYLNVVPNIIWLTPDVLGEEFDIYSNVVWRIEVEDVEPEEPTIVFYLTNGTMVTNDTLLKNEDVTSISLLKNNDLVHNMYYFNNQ